MTEQSMRFSDIISRVLRCWPDEISTSDRIITMVGEELRMRFPALSEAEDAAEQSLLAAGDEMGHLVNWTLFTALHEIGRRQDIVFPHLVYRGYVKWLFEKSLQDDMYKDVAREYWSNNQEDN